MRFRVDNVRAADPQHVLESHAGWQVVVDPMALIWHQHLAAGGSSGDLGDLKLSPLAVDAHDARITWGPAGSRSRAPTPATSRFG